MCKLSCRSGHPPLSLPTFLPYYLSPSSFLLPHLPPLLPPSTLTSLASLLPPSHPLPPSFHSHIPHLPPSSLSTLTSLTSLPHLHVTFLSVPLSQGGLVFICGTLDGLIQILSRRHNTEDLIATVMAVEPHSFIYKGRWVCITHHILHTSHTHHTITVTLIKHATI